MLSCILRILTVMSIFYFSAKNLIASEDLNKVPCSTTLDEDSKSQQAANIDNNAVNEDSQTLAPHVNEIVGRISRSLAGLPIGIQEKLLTSFYLNILNIKILVKEKNGYDGLFDPENQSLRINLFEVFDTMMRELKTLPKEEFDPQNFKLDEDIQVS